ncbi:MAG: zinc metalloprotease HtpX [Desulfobacterales bacterium]|nr:zinc metalloprotease HtpX [Desulfobacterales bacterium]
MGSRIRTLTLMTVLTVLIMWVGQMIGGTGGMIIALLFAGGINFFSYYYSDKMVLKMYRAQPVTRQDAPDLYGLVENLAAKADLPMPTLYIIPQQSPNAFATGRNPQNAVVAVTEGLLRYMNRDELAGVIAHELGHVKNRDMLIQTIAATMAGAVMMLATFARWSAIFGGMGGGDNEEGGGIIGLLAMSIIAPLAAMLIQMAISRSREYLADSTSAQITGNSEGLARALDKLGAYSKKIPMQAEPATAHMFISNPLSGQSLMHLFSTHPPIEKRIARLTGGGSGGSNASAGPEEKTMSDTARNFWNRLS